MSLYNEFHREIQSYWLNGHPEMVLEILKEGIDRFPQHLSELLFEGIMACIDVNQKESALNMIKLADKQGFWYPPEVFPEEDLFKPYLDKWQKQRCSVGTTALEVGHEGNSNMLALHGWGEDMHLFRRYFYSDAYEKRGRIHYLQSSQQIGTIQYVWNDRKQAEHDIRHYLCEAVGEMKISALAGFSQGGYLALDLAVHEVVDIEKLVLLCPGKEDYTLQSMVKLAENGVEVLLISGSEDHEHAYHNALYDLLQEAGVRVQYDVVEGMGHWFPEDIDARLNDFL